VYPKVPGQCS